MTEDCVRCYNREVRREEASERESGRDQKRERISYLEYVDKPAAFLKPRHALCMKSSSMVLLFFSLANIFLHCLSQYKRLLSEATTIHGNYSNVIGPKYCYA